MQEINLTNCHMPTEIGTPYISGLPVGASPGETIPMRSGLSGSTYGISLAEANTDLFAVDYRKRLIYLIQGTSGISQKDKYAAAYLKTEKARAGDNILVYIQSEKGWAMLAARQFLEGYDEVDSIYDEP